MYIVVSGLTKSEIAPAKADLVPWLNENLEFPVALRCLGLVRSNRDESTEWT